MNTDINKEELPVPSDQSAAVEKVKQDTEDIDFSQGVLTYVDVDFSEYRKKILEYQNLEYGFEKQQGKPILNATWISAYNIL